MTPGQVAVLAREAQASGDAALAARCWQTYEMAVMIANGEWGRAARLVEQAYTWPEPINDPEWNR